MTDAQCMEHRVTVAERFWRGLGFRYHLGEFEPPGPVDGRAWSGWMRTESTMFFNWRDRLRLLVSGRLHIKHTFHTDTPSPDKVHTRFDWEILRPGEDLARRVG